MRWLVTSLRRKRTNCNGFFYWSGTGYFRWSQIGSVSRTPTNVSVRNPGEMIGPAAVFSKSRIYPCDIVSLDPVTVMMFRRDDVLTLMQKDKRILENFTTEIASSTYLLQQRLEMFSYSGIAQKAAFWLLIQARKTGNVKVRIPGSVSKWAMLMNVSRPSLHRELRKLEDAGVITYSPPMITIIDADALQDVLSR